MELFAGRLKELRNERGLSQQDVGSFLNVSKMAVSHWEKGHSEPSIAQLVLLSDYFEVTVDYLVGKVD
jgi:transcriptional regulator with XRE-family HTH domain